MKTGSCLCGRVRYRVTGPLRPITTCHCTMCRKQTGLYYATTQADLNDFELISEETLTWYESSALTRRGFCSNCGSVLFWHEVDGDAIAILAGSIDGETGLSIDRQIFTAYKGDFYDLIPDVPAFEEGG